MIPSTNPQSLQLSMLISEKTVKAKVMAASWQDATDYVGNLLVMAGKIKPDYISAMKQVLKEMGPYAVIAPGIVLLHARPEDGVIEPCLGLITLATPVSFGHSQNDPVDLVFALGAVDKQAHISSLQQLAEILGCAEKLSKIRSANNDKDLMSIFGKP